jgi:hypothetical protein
MTDVWPIGCWRIRHSDNADVARKEPPYIQNGNLKLVSFVVGLHGEFDKLAISGTDDVAQISGEKLRVLLLPDRICAVILIP